VGKIFENFAAVPAVIAAGEHVYAVMEKFVGQARGDAETGGGIFAIGYDQIDFFLGHDVAQAIAHNLPSGRTDNVTNEENTHVGSLQLMERAGKESLNFS
jgi:hypothetical protein